MKFVNVDWIFLNCESYHITSWVYLLDLAVIPVTDSNHELLPIQFSVDPGPEILWSEDQENPSLLSRYDIAGESNGFIPG